MDSPLVDILVPTYEPTPAYLREAIESALKQTEKRWHMIIRDDASVADVRSILEPFLEDSRITFIRGDKRMGIGGNWNACVKMGSAPFVQFLFQDDRWDPPFLERGLRAMEAHQDVGIVSLGHEYESAGGALNLALYRQVEEFRREHLKNGWHEGRGTLRFWLQRELHPNIIGEPDFVMLRRSLMQNAGLYLEDMPQNLDVEYALRCLLQSNWYYVKESSGWFRVHPKAASAVNQREGKGIFDRFRCFERIIELLPPGEERDMALEARNRALTDMARKFLRRLKGGKMVRTGGSGGESFRAFAMQHPRLILGALLRALTGKA